MHELSVTEHILNLALQYAEKNQATRVTDIYLVIGRLSSFVDDSIQFYWDLISQNTLCEGAALHFERVPARLLCLNCEQEFEIHTELAPCPNCFSTRVKVLTGEEFYLDSIAIETTTEKENEQSSDHC
ncbi:hydrogenase maturation nickel metallochaperone HypA [Anaerolinea thermophila]|uniref:Hydrogenase maturation factor HypA n=1 Tax=Anaerolinea thermophila (strain DSM 14523 / JCM 11388 / NBRC 100420 / UNI-1) TaxID=926569 RepID=E8N5U6_ANATU|nr:putative hydrogenase nickel incorporation protein HypA [Anaerolinea thermophila UNI-1]